jgi:hypothetical protein
LSVERPCATAELTRYLQDIGCRTAFLPGNEAEVSNVLSAVIDRFDRGEEIEGEVGDAISRGEVRIDYLRMLADNFVTELSKSNIFPFDEESLALTRTEFQINEFGFSQYLFEAAKSRGRAYGYQNRVNDAGYLAAVMRLRGPTRSRDFFRSGYVFVTTNRMLAVASRSYLVKQKQLTEVQCAPILHHTQAAAIAWLLKDHKLSPQIAAHELLLNCYAAARPDSAWLKSFR